MFKCREKYGCLYEIIQPLLYTRDGEMRSRVARGYRIHPQYQACTEKPIPIEHLSRNVTLELSQNTTANNDKDLINLQLVRSSTAFGQNSMQ